MERNNAFDAKLALYDGKIPADVHAALVHLIDSLDMCWAGAQAVFSDQARPEHALDLLRALEERLLSGQAPQVR